MEVAKLDKRVELINEVRMDDGAGGFTRQDTVEATVWANVKLAGASRQQSADRTEHRASHVVTIRWQPKLATGFKVGRVRYVERGVVRELKVSTIVDPDGGANWLQLQCDEGGPL